MQEGDPPDAPDVWGHLRALPLRLAVQASVRVSGDDQLEHDLKKAREWKRKNKYKKKRN